jgi:CO dehydrogenase nickel-insertion accessory protein CooC1
MRYESRIAMYQTYGKARKRGNAVTEKHRALVGKRIGFFGKGGSGKSTAVVLLAQALQERGYDVCVLDADSTNVGLHHALDLEQAPAPLLEHFGGMVFSGGSVTCPVDDPVPLAGATISVTQLPAQYYRRNADGILFLTAGKIGDQGPGAGCDGPITKIARDFRFHQDGERFLTLVDFKAGFEDSARGAITSVDWALVVVDPTIAAIQMAGHMRDMVDQIKAGGLPATRHLETPELVEWANRIFRESRVKDVLVILNRIKGREMERSVREKLAGRGIEPIGVIPEDPSIALAWLNGTRLDAVNAQADVERVVERLEAVAEATSVAA